jgi:hypothetical protein
MYPQATVNMALLLSAIGIIDKENALICGVAVATIRHWRCGRRRAPGDTADRRKASCPLCHGRSMDESAYAYLLGLYLGDGCITRGRRDVFALCVACCDDWPGLLAAAQRAMSDVMPTSGVFCVHQQGCTMVKSTSKHWPCLFPQHGPGRKHHRKIQLEQWQLTIVTKYLVHSPRDCSIRTAGAVLTGYGGGSLTVITGMSIRGTCSATSPATFCGCAGRRWISSGWRGGSRGGTPFRWRGGRRWRGWTSSSGPSTDGGQAGSGEG